MPSKITFWKQMRGLLSTIASSAGLMPTANLGTGTANNTSVLRGDQVYAVIAVGTTGTDVNVASAASTITIHVPTASATARGVLSTGTQTIAGMKTFGEVNLVGLSDATEMDSQPFATQTVSQAIWRSTAGTAWTIIDASGRLITGSNSFTVNNSFNATLWNGGFYGWASAGSISGTSAVDTGFVRDGAAGAIAARVGTTAHSVRTYNTWTSATNYERAVIDWITTANTCRIGTEKGSGGGTARDLALVTDATVRLTIHATTGLATFASGIAVTGGVAITLGSDATGDIWYRNSGGAMTRLGVGSNGDVLTLAAGLPSWAAGGGGGLTQPQVMARGLGC